MTIRAVLFDIGGVLTDVGRDRAVDALTAAGLDPAAVFELMNDAFNGVDSDSPYHRAERGEAPLQEVLDWAEARLPGAARVFDPDDELFVAGEPDLVEEMWEAACRIRAAGYRVGCISNAISEWVDAMPADRNAWFDEAVAPVVFSCHIGVRKPDPGAFTRMCELLGVEPTEAVMVDDSEVNCRGAEAAGLSSVHVVDARAQAADLLAQLDC